MTALPAPISAVAYVCADPGVPVFGRKGSSVHVQGVVRALLRLGVEVDLFASRTDGEPPEDLRNVRLHKLPRPPKGDLEARERGLLAANAELRAALEGSGPFDLIYERYSLWSRAGVEHAREAGIPSVLEVNSPLIPEQAEHRGLVARPAAEEVARAVFGGADALVAVSEGVAEYLRGYSETAGRVCVIPNGVEAARYSGEVAPALPKREGEFTVGFVGTLKPWHGLSGLVEAFAELHRKRPGSRLLVVGDGPERESVERMLAGHGLLAKARLTGAVGPEEVPGLLASMDVAVAPYPALAGFYFSPLKVYEYLAAGLPVVASRVGQLGDLISSEENGLLYPPGEIQALAEALVRLHDDPDLRTRLGEAGRREVLAEHTWDAVVAKTLEAVGVRAGAGEAHGR